MELLITWLVFAAVPAIIAPSRGRSALNWFLVSVLISPLIGLILVLALPSQKDAPEAAVVRLPCPRCGESIATSAQVCRFCGAQFGPA